MFAKLLLFTKFFKKSSSSTSKKEVVTKLLHVFKNGDIAYAKSVLSPNYIQHNLDAANGPEGFINWATATSKVNTSVEIVRLIEDGDYVVSHSKYNFGPVFGGGKDLVAIDVFRFENGKIAEHWDSISPVTRPNASNRTQLDGTTTIKDRDKTKVNKEIVRKTQEALIKKDLQAALHYLDPSYIQHNPNAGDGIAGVQKALAEAAKAGKTLAFGKIHHVIGEGDFVFISSEGKIGDATDVAIFDIFRVHDGRIIEHWDVISPYDETKKNAGNPNGKW